MVKTAVFKIHHPTNKKKALLQSAFKNYHLLCGRLIGEVKKDQDDFYSSIGKPNRIGEMTYRDRAGKQYFPRRHKNILNSFNLPSSLKYAACVDAARALISYKELSNSRPDTSYPAFQILKPDNRARMFDNALESLMVCVDLEEENTLSYELNRQGRDKAFYRPLYFTNCNDTGNPGIYLLNNPQDKTYSAVLHVAPSTRREKLVITEKHNLFDAVSGKKFVTSRGTATGLLFPLETGERVVQRFFKSGGIPKEGKLAYDPLKDEYYLHVAFEFRPQKLEPEAFMGIDRGIAALCAWTVLDKANKVVVRGKFDGAILNDYLKQKEKRISELQRRGRTSRSSARGRWADFIIHRATNQLAELALKYKAQLYIEDLTNITDRSMKRKKSAFNRMLNRSQYQKLTALLHYKLEQRGLPPAKEVRPAFTSMICAMCGHNAKENRPKTDKAGNAIQHVFKCVSCGHEDNADLNASHVIALKGQWHYIRKNEKKKLGIEKFEDYLKNVL